MVDAVFYLAPVHEGFISRSLHCMLYGNPCAYAIAPVSLKLTLNPPYAFFFGGRLRAEAPSLRVNVKTP